MLKRSLRIRLGLLDDQPKVEVKGHMWVREKPQWRTLENSLPIYLNDDADDGGIAGDGHQSKITMKEMLILPLL